MKSIQSIRVNLLFIFLFCNGVSCKPQIMATSAPFDIDEKTYFYWVGGKQGTQGTTINLLDVQNHLIFLSLNYIFKITNMISFLNLIVMAL